MVDSFIHSFILCLFICPFVSKYTSAISTFLTARKFSHQPDARVHYLRLATTRSRQEPDLDMLSYNKYKPLAPLTDIIINHGRFIVLWVYNDVCHVKHLLVSFSSASSVLAESYPKFTVIFRLLSMVHAMCRGYNPLGAHQGSSTVMSSKVIYLDHPGPRVRERIMTTNDPGLWADPTSG